MAGSCRLGGGSEDSDEPAEMVLRRRTSQLGGSPPRRGHRGALRTRGRSGVPDRLGGAGPTVGAYRQLAARRGRRLGGERYLVSMLGEEVNWVRNVRAAGGEVALRHGRREEVHLQEVVAPDLRAPVLKAYLKRATNASAHMPIDKDAPLAEFERLAPHFPVFRIVPRKPA